MNLPNYPFNPHDWTTITPLLDELVNKPVSKDGFLAWLEAWNQLDIDLWDAYTQLKHPAYVDTSNHKAEEAYQAYVKELYSTYIEYTNKLMVRALELQPKPPAPIYKQLWRRWHNQTTLLSSENLPVQAEISALENRYRTIMWQYDGTSENPLSYWMDRRDELNDLMMHLLKLRRTLAQNSGSQTYLVYRWQELNRLDYSIADCQAFHRAVEEMVPAIAEFRSRSAVWKQPFPQVDDANRLTEGTERILRQIDPEFGDIFQAMRDGYLDLGRRPNKAGSNESWFFSRAGMPYIHVASGNAAAVFHESGHSFHDYLSFQAHGSLWNFNGPEVFQEFASTGMEMLCWPYYEQSKGGLYTAAESVLARQSSLQTFLGFCGVQCVLEDAFEHWLYGNALNDVTPDDLDTKWLELKQRFEPWDDDYTNEDEKMTGWQRNTFSLFRWPLYMATYAMSMVGTCQLARLAEIDRKNTIENYKAALTMGNTQSLPELFRTVGILFPFTNDTVKDAIQYVFDQSLEMQTHSLAQ